MKKYIAIKNLGKKHFGSFTFSYCGNKPLD
jgi:hypothetical protein